MGDFSPSVQRGDTMEEISLLASRSAVLSFHQPSYASKMTSNSQVATTTNGIQLTSHTYKTAL
jgi:hypothetical protein